MKKWMTFILFKTMDMKVEVYTTCDERRLPSLFCFGWTKKRVIQEFKETGKITTLKGITHIQRLVAVDVR